MMARASGFNVREAVIEVARFAMQKGGYSALSFRDLAAEIGVKSSTIHYHFPTKADLARELIVRYSDDVDSSMSSVLDKPFDEAIDEYLAVFKVAFDGTNRMCLVGMMAAEVNALPPPVRDQIVQFTSRQTEWLEAVLLKKHRRLPQKSWNL